jgi:hypothetical protein
MTGLGDGFYPVVAELVYTGESKLIKAIHIEFIPDQFWVNERDSGATSATGGQQNASSWVPQPWRRKNGGKIYSRRLDKVESRLLEINAQLKQIQAQRWECLSARPECLSKRWEFLSKRLLVRKWSSKISRSKLADKTAAINTSLPTSYTYGDGPILEPLWRRFKQPNQWS